jgi:hypothetical protein
VLPLAVSGTIVIGLAVAVCVVLVIALLRLEDAEERRDERELAHVDGSPATPTERLSPPSSPPLPPPGPPA